MYQFFSLWSWVLPKSLKWVERKEQFFALNEQSDLGVDVLISLLDFLISRFYYKKFFKITTVEQLFVSRFEIKSLNAKSHRKQKLSYNQE
jgi:hypothetical protein